jgi:hypothetical protein
VTHASTPIGTEPGERSQPRMVPTTAELPDSDAAAAVEQAPPLPDPSTAEPQVK